MKTGKMFPVLVLKVVGNMFSSQFYRNSMFTCREPPSAKLRYLLVFNSIS